LGYVGNSSAEFVSPNVSISGDNSFIKENADKITNWILLCKKMMLFPDKKGKRVEVVGNILSVDGFCGSFMM